MKNWKKWFKAAAVRAVKTVAQTAVGYGNKTYK